MRLHKYNAFLLTQLSYHDIDDILGKESHKQLINHFGESPAVFEAEEDLNKEAHDMAMNSFVVCKQHDSYDVIVHVCDGTQPCRRGNYFVRDGISYLAYTGWINHDNYDLASMKVLKDVLAESLETCK